MSATIAWPGTQARIPQFAWRRQARAQTGLDRLPARPDIRTGGRGFPMRPSGVWLLDDVIDSSSPGSRGVAKKFDRVGLEGMSFGTRGNYARSDERFFYIKDLPTGARWEGGCERRVVVPLVFDDRESNPRPENYRLWTFRLLSDAEMKMIAAAPTSNAQLRKAGHLRRITISLAQIIYRLLL